MANGFADVKSPSSDYKHPSSSAPRRQWARWSSPAACPDEPSVQQVRRNQLHKCVGVCALPLILAYITRLRTGFEMMARVASGQYVPQPSMSCCTMLAFVLNRSSRVMPVVVAHVESSRESEFRSVSQRALCCKYSVDCKLHGRLQRCACLARRGIGAIALKQRLTWLARHTSGDNDDIGACKGSLEARVARRWPAERRWQRPRHFGVGRNV